MKNYKNTPNNTTSIDCKPSYTLEMDFESIVFDESFKNIPSKKNISNQNSQNKVEISKNFRIPELNYYVLDKYAFTYYEDLEFMDKFAPIPDNKEIAKLSKKPSVRKEIKISKENFVIPMSNYSYDQYDSLFIEDLEFLDKYAPIDKIDDCFLSDIKNKSSKSEFKNKNSYTVEVVEDKPIKNSFINEIVKNKSLVVAEEIERAKPSVIVSKHSKKFSSINRMPVKRNLDKILRN